MAVHPNSLKAIAPYKRKKGQPALNKSGRNGWTKMRERYRIGLDEKLDAITKTLLEFAEKGDTQAIALALKPILNVSQHELSGPDGAPVNFIELARKAQESEEAKGTPDSH